MPLECRDIIEATQDAGCNTAVYLLGSSLAIASGCANNCVQAAISTACPILSSVMLPGAGSNSIRTALLIMSAAGSYGAYSHLPDDYHINILGAACVNLVTTWVDGVVARASIQRPDRNNGHQQ